MGPGEVAWDVDRYNLPHGEEVGAVLILVLVGEQQPIDAGTPCARASGRSGCR